MRTLVVDYVIIIIITIMIQSCVDTFYKLLLYENLESCKLNAVKQSNFELYSVKNCDWWIIRMVLVFNQSDCLRPSKIWSMRTGIVLGLQPITMRETEVEMIYFKIENCDWLILLLGYNQSNSRIEDKLKCRLNIKNFNYLILRIVLGRSSLEFERSFIALRRWTIYDVTVDYLTETCYSATHWPAFCETLSSFRIKYYDYLWFESLFLHLVRR